MDQETLDGFVVLIRAIREIKDEAFDLFEREEMDNDRWMIISECRSNLQT